MLYGFVGGLKRIVENPYLNIIVGLLFLYSGISETVNEWTGLEDFKIGAHHGVILFATLHILKTFPDFFEGLEYIEKVGEENKRK